MAASVAVAQGYPTRPIRMIVPFPAGGAGDVLARVIGQKMQDNWGQTVIVDNRPGGNTIIASFGTGSSSHLAGELFMSMAGIQMVHIPYKGAPPAITDLVGGQVQIFFSGLPPGLPFVKEGRCQGPTTMATTTSTGRAQRPGGD